MCDAASRISSYSTPYVAIDPCNASTSIGNYDKPTTGDDCLCMSGFKPLSSTWTLTSADIPLLSTEFVKGELNFYVQDGAGVVSFVQGTVAKTSGTITARAYQRNGNLTNVAFASTATTITITWSPAVSGYWSFRGF